MNYLFKEYPTFVSVTFTGTITQNTLRSLFCDLVQAANANNKSPDVFLRFSAAANFELSFDHFFEVITEINQVAIHNDFNLVVYVTKGLPLAFMKAFQRAELHKYIHVEIVNDSAMAAAILNISADILNA